MKKQETKQAHEAWKIIKKWTKNNRDRFIEGAEINTLGEFKDVWKDATAKTFMGKVQQVKSSMLYQTSVNTAKQMHHRITELSGKGTVSIKKLRTMNTHEAMEEYFEDDLMKYYKKLLSDGMTKKEAGKQIGRYYFGS